MSAPLLVPAGSCWLAAAGARWAPPVHCDILLVLLLSNGRMRGRFGLRHLALLVSCWCPSPAWGEHLGGTRPRVVVDGHSTPTVVTFGRGHAGWTGNETTTPYRTSNTIAASFVVRASSSLLLFLHRYCLSAVLLVPATHASHLMPKKASLCTSASASGSPRSPRLPRPAACRTD